MEDCECERRLSDPLDPPSEEAMKRASDVLEHYLKTMRELNRKSKLPIEVTEEHIKIINRFMEEKKTKKMTKAEAFEWLKCKKVHVSGKVISDDVLTRLFACGIEWCNGGTDICYYSDYLIISSLGLLTHCGGTDLHYWERHGYEEISADDILSIEIVDEKKPSQEFVPYELTEMGKVQSTLDDGEVLIITRKQILKIQL